MSRGLDQSAGMVTELFLGVWLGTQLLRVDENSRACCLDDIRDLELLTDVDWNAVLAKERQPPFTPPVRAPSQPSQPSQPLTR